MVWKNRPDNSISTIFDLELLNRFEDCYWPHVNIRITVHTKITTGNCSCSRLGEPNHQGQLDSSWATGGNGLLKGGWLQFTYANVWLRFCVDLRASRQPTKRLLPSLSKYLPEQRETCQLYLLGYLSCINHMFLVSYRSSWLLCVVCVPCLSTCLCPARSTSSCFPWTL